MSRSQLENGFLVHFMGFIRPFLIGLSLWLALNMLMGVDLSLGLFVWGISIFAPIAAIDVISRKWRESKLQDQARSPSRSFKIFTVAITLAAFAVFGYIVWRALQPVEIPHEVGVQKNHQVR